MFRGLGVDMIRGLEVDMFRGLEVDGVLIVRIFYFCKPTISI